MHQRSEKNVVKGSKYAHWIGLYLSFHLNWVLGPFVHGRLQNLQTSEITFAHVITLLRIFEASTLYDSGLPILHMSAFVYCMPTTAME